MSDSSDVEPDMDEWRRLRKTQIDLRVAIRDATDESQRSVLRQRLEQTREALAEMEFRSSSPARASEAATVGASNRSAGSGHRAAPERDDPEVEDLLSSLLGGDGDGERPLHLASQGPGEGLQQVMWGLVVAAVLLTTSYMLSLVVVPRPDGGYITLWDGWVYHAAILVPAALAALRAITDRRGRWAWWLVTLGIVLYAGGNLLYTYHDQNLDPIPFPAWSDVPYLESSLAFILAIALVAHLHVKGVSRATRLNGLVIGLAAASVAVALWFDTILQQSGSTSAVLVGLAYPLSDLVFIVVALSGLSVAGYRPSPAVAAFIGGAALWAVGDIVFLRQVAADTYVPGTILEATWVTGILLFGAAPWLPRRRSDRGPSPAAMGSALIPWVAAVAALGVIGWSVNSEIPSLAVWLAMAAIVTVLLRIALSVSELRRANEAFSQAWLGEVAGFRDRPSLQLSSTAEPRSASSLPLLAIGAVAVTALIGVGALMWQVASDRNRELVAADSTETAIAGPETAVDTTEAGDTTTELADTTTTAGVTPATASDLRVDTLQQGLNRLLSFTPIVFEPSQRDLSDNNRRVLNSAAALLLSSPGIPVKVVGYTDDSGSVATNQQVSTARANAVRDYLVSKGVAAADLVAEGRGKAIASGVADQSGLERRVEFEVIAPTTVPAAAPLAELKVGVVASSAGNDLAFTQSMVDSLDILTGQRRGLTVTVVDNTIVAGDALAAIADMAGQGYRLIVAHDPQLGPLIPAIAEQYPDVVFAWGPTSQPPPRANIYTYNVAAEQGGYVLGALAASLSTSNSIGVVGPIAAGDSQRYIGGFKAGALAEKPTVAVRVDYTGSFLDASLAAETAKAQVDAGADVLTGSGPAGTGAAAVATQGGKLWIGNQANQSVINPTLVVGSQVYHWDVVLREIVADIDAGALHGRNVTGDLANGGLTVELNPAHPLDPARAQRVADLTAAVRDHTIKPPVS